MGLPGLKVSVRDTGAGQQLGVHVRKRLCLLSCHPASLTSPISQCVSVRQPGSTAQSRAQSSLTLTALVSLTG